MTGLLDCQTGALNLPAVTPPCTDTSYRANQPAGSRLSVHHHAIPADEQVASSTFFSIFSQLCSSFHSLQLESPSLAIF